MIGAAGPYTNLALLERSSPGILATARLVLMGGFVFPPRKGFLSGGVKWITTLKSIRNPRR